MRRAVIVTDLGFGDAGKGSVVDYLTRQSDPTVIIRHNGGAQAAHNVVTPDGRHHTFSQFGSGSFVPGAKTYLSRYMLANPLNMFAEAEALHSAGVDNVWLRTSIDRNALLVTPWQQAANRLRELARGGQRHGSCGQGIGEAMADSINCPDLVLRAGDADSDRLRSKLIALRDYKLDQLRCQIGASMLSDEWSNLGATEMIDSLVEAYRCWANLVQVVDEAYLGILAQGYQQLIFEGAQGVLLDEWFGFHPYTTWSTTTSANARKLLDDIQFDGDITQLGLLRTYSTRHGAGPFVTEDAGLNCLPELHNSLCQWQGQFRRGYFDVVAYRYALAVNGGVDGLVVSHLDQLDLLPERQVCVAYVMNSPAYDASRFFELDGDLIMAIKPGLRGDLDYQTRLTELLASCSPVLELVGGDYLAAIEKRLDCPVAIASYGPTAQDKHQKI